MLLALGALASAACGQADNVIGNEPLASDLVAGRRDLRWAASGYLTRGPSMEGLDRAKPVCGATLIAPDVAVTAAHCVVDDGATYAFGSGDAGGAPVVRVVERHLHPGYRPEGRAEPSRARGSALTNDIAYVILERPIDFVEPAELATAAPASGCTVQAIGYRSAEGAIAVRASTPACVERRPDRFVLQPEGSEPLCVAESDDGSVIVSRDASRTVLVGIYVADGAASRVTSHDGDGPGGLAHCRRSTDASLEGWEPAFAYRDFLVPAVIARLVASPGNEQPTKR